MHSPCTYRPLAVYLLTYCLPTVRRLLAGKADELMDVISTVVVQELGHDKTRGFPVINRMPPHRARTPDEQAGSGPHTGLLLTRASLALDRAVDAAEVARAQR